MKLAIVGATGLVGHEVLEVLEARSFPFDELLLVASERSVGKKMTFMDKEYTVISIPEAIRQAPDIAIFSAGGATSLKYAPQFADVGTKVIDNSSAWRMDADKPLVVPEVNGHTIKENDNIIANPNCSTIQMVVPLKPLHDEYKITRVVVSTYQSVSGSGKKAVDQMLSERAGQVPDMAYPHPIDLNALPHIDVFQDNGYTKEEMKMTNETKKILDTNIDLTATCVRIPTAGGHSEALTIELEKDFDIEKVRRLIAEMPGCIVQDDPQNNVYPMPINAHKKDEIFIGRIRRDVSKPNSLCLWIVADNLRKGAATNTVQIAEYLVRHDMVS